MTGSMTMVHVTNRVTPGSECNNPTLPSVSSEVAEASKRKHPTKTAVAKVATSILLLVLTVAASEGGGDAVAAAVSSSACCRTAPYF
jgi:hypothetical protein